MRNRGYAAIGVLVVVAVALIVWIFTVFSPYDICVSYYTKQATSSMGSNAVSYAENLCDKKIRFWK